jgi:hypothetical protein
MEAKKTKKPTEPEVKLSDKYQSVDALYSEKENQFQLFGQWKAKMEEIVKKTNKVLRIKQIAVEGKMNEEALSFLPSSILKRQLIAGNYSIESIEDSAYAYLEEVHRELKITYEAVTKKDYKKLVNLFFETLPNDLRQLIATNAIGCVRNNDDLAKAIYVILVEVKKKQYLEKLFEDEDNNAELEIHDNLKDIKYALKLGKKINPMTYILIDDLRKRIPLKADELSVYKLLLAKTFEVDPNTITRYLDGRLTNDTRNDPYRSKIALEYALNFFEELKNSELVEKIEKLIHNL